MAKPDEKETAPHLLVVIDHQEARVYRTEVHGAVPERIAPYDPHGYKKHLHSAHEWTDGKQYEKDKPDFVLELGDLIDAADSVETEKSYLKTVNKVFSAISKDRHYVLGNHCVDTLTKEEFLEGVEQKKSHYSFDSGGIHFVVLDACFSSNGKPYGRKSSKWNDANIPKEQVDWLKDDLKGTEKKVVVFAHQRLDVANDYAIKNAADVRKVLEASGKVLAVFHGHSHKNDYKDINGIHYCTLVAMIEGSGADNNGYSVMAVQTDGAISVTGFRKQKKYGWAEKMK